MTARWTPTPSASQQARGKRVLVMGSGSGSNFEALFHTLSPHGIVFAGLFCDKPGAYILERAARLGVPSTTPPPIPPETDPPPHPKRHLNDAVMAFLDQPFDALVLAGYMRILPTRVVTPYAGKILNIHPSKLPDYPGLHAIRKAYNAGESRIGVTVHLVTPEVDAGPILGQETISISPGESLEAVETRVHALEHELYPRVVFDFLTQAPQPAEQ